MIVIIVRSHFFESILFFQVVSLESHLFKQKPKQLLLTVLYFIIYYLLLHYNLHFFISFEQVGRRERIVKK